MPEYVHAPIEDGGDLDRLQQEAFDYIQSRWPNWTPAEGDFEAWLLAACARIIVEMRRVASDVPSAIFRYFGARLIGVPPLDAQAATVSSTWTLAEAAPEGGVTILAGTLVSIEDPDDEPVTFEVMNDVTIAEAATATTAGEVVLVSTEEGEYTSGLGGLGVEATMIDAVDYDPTIVLSSLTTGGRDDEEDEDYLNRLSERLTLLAPRPIRARDFEIMARQLAAQEGTAVRVLVRDNYNPADDTDDNEKMVAMAMIDDETGLDVTTELRDAVFAELELLREVQFVINTMTPTRTPVDVHFVGVPEDGYDWAAVEPEAEAAVSAYLSAVNWGMPAVGEERRWIHKPTVRHQDLSTVLNNVVGFSHWTTLEMRIGAAAYATTDITLPGDAPLPSPGVINGEAE